MKPNAARHYNIHMNLNAALAFLAEDAAAPLDIAELGLCLARDEYPDLDVEAHLAEVNAIAHEAKAFVRGNFEARVAGLCRYLFHEMGFHGNARDYYDPRNSYFHLVLERRTGIPISLSAVVMAVGARVGLNVAGVALPGHFVVKVIEDDREVLVDPFHGGRSLTPADCENLVRQATGREFLASADGLRTVPLGRMILRMLNNLKAIYLAQKDFARAIRVMERMCQLNDDYPGQRRDLGASLLHAGQPGKAIDHLTAYLVAHPEADDADVVRLLLKEARGAIAGLN
jgi:regulator of sirC expression with transglutaminase-like and TPR domain